MSDFTLARTAKSAVSTGITSQAVAAGANYLGSEMDNSAAENPSDATTEITYDSASSPAAGKTLELYLLRAPDGTNYEEGDASPTDPADHKQPVLTLALDEDTDTHRFVFDHALPPDKCKWLVKSESDQSCTVTVKTWTTKPHLTQD